MTTIGTQGCLSAFGKRLARLVSDDALYHRQLPMHVVLCALGNCYSTTRNRKQLTLRIRWVISDHVL
jgi:hypothetical protein